MSKDDEKLAVAAFIAEYGPIAEFADTDKWLVWLGVWISAWYACLDFVRRSNDDENA